MSEEKCDGKLYMVLSFFKKVSRPAGWNVCSRFDIKVNFSATTERRVARTRVSFNRHITVGAFNQVNIEMKERETRRKKNVECECKLLMRREIDFCDGVIVINGEGTTLNFICQQATTFSIGE